MQTDKPHINMNVLKFWTFLILNDWTYHNCLSFYSDFWRFEPNSSEKRYRCETIFEDLNFWGSLRRNYHHPTNDFYRWLQTLSLRQFWRCENSRPHFEISETTGFSFIWFTEILPWGTKTICKSSLNSHVYWDTLYNNVIDFFALIYCVGNIIMYYSQFLWTTLYNKALRSCVFYHILWYWWNLQKCRPPNYHRSCI